MKPAATLWAVLILAINCCTCGEDTSRSVNPAAVELARHDKEKQYSSAHIEPARMDGQPGIAVVFEGTSDLHYYAKPETAPAVGAELKIKAKSDDFGFGQAVFPKWDIFQDPTGKKVEVYAGRFAVFVPIKTVRAPTKTTTIDKGDVEVTISGQACTKMVCLRPFIKTLHATVDYSQANSWKEISFEPAGGAGTTAMTPSYPIWFALALAFLAGLSLNIMPCVWPVLPLIIMRIVGQAKESRGRAIAMGLVFCLGILLFFACLAGANIVLQVFYGTVLQWGDQFRNPAFVAAMALLLVVLALFMFGVFTITVPSSIADKSGSGKGYTGALATGFLAAILSTPCSFGILAAAFAWAQGQHLLLGTFAIMVIGIGMAVPYAILTSLPGLLKRLPKAGRWMELFKQAVGFALLGIAVWLMAALPQERRIGVLYFAVVLAFCIWMWGGWVSYNTKPARKFLVRIVAVALVVVAGLFFLLPRAKIIDWQPYDAAMIKTALDKSRPVLIKFTADWCVSCKFIEKAVYSRKDVAELVRDKNALAIKADTTVKDNPATLALKEVYHEPAVPVSILLLPAGQEKRWHDKLFADELRIALQKLPSK